MYKEILSKNLLSAWQQ